MFTYHGRTTITNESITSITMQLIVKHVFNTSAVSLKRQHVGVTLLLKGMCK